MSTLCNLYKLFTDVIRIAFKIFNDLFPNITHAVTLSSHFCTIFKILPPFSFHKSIFSLYMFFLTDASGRIQKTSPSDSPQLTCTSRSHSTGSPTQTTHAILFASSLTSGFTSKKGLVLDCHSAISPMVARCQPGSSTAFLRGSQCCPHSRPPLLPHCPWMDTAVLDQD